MYIYIYICIHIPKALVSLEWLEKWLQLPKSTEECSPGCIRDLIAASIFNNYSVGASIRPIYTRCCFTMTNLIQV